MPPSPETAFDPLLLTQLADRVRRTSFLHVHVRSSYYPTYSLPLLPLSRRRKDPGKHTRGHSGERGPPPARATHAVVERGPPSPSIPVRFVLYDAHPSGYTHLRKAAASERRPKLHDSSMPCTPHAVVSDCWHGMRRGDEAQWYSAARHSRRATRADDIKFAMRDRVMSPEGKYQVVHRRRRMAQG